MRKTYWFKTSGLRACLMRIIAVSMLGWIALTGGNLPMAWGHDRPTGPIEKTRSAVMARNGMAATSQPLATAAAIRILQEGGNAIDAAIAANAVLGVVEPMSCGIGGDLFAIVWDAETGSLHGLNASGRAPKRATIQTYREQGLEAIPTYGPLSWSVPGCVDGWVTLHERFGKLPLDQVLEPAITYASEGFPVSEVIAASWNSASERLSEIPTSAACYLPEGRAPQVAEMYRNPGLARSLQAIASHGREVFYRGEIAQRIADYSEQVGGLIRLEDLEAHTSTWIDPVSTTYRGHEVWELPPNGQGIAALQMLNLIEPYDLAALGPQSAQTLHLMIEAKKLVFEDRAKYYADPEFAQVPVEGLISKEYAHDRSEEFDQAFRNQRASEQVVAGQPPESDTIYMTVVDGDLNCVSLIQSIFHGFGSSHVPGDPDQPEDNLGFAIQNRGALFALDPEHANRLEPGKRPFHTIIPGFVTKDGRPWATFGVMGGDMQPQGHLQVLTNMIDFGMDVQEAGDAPRFRHFGSSTPTGIPAEGAGRVALESGIDPEVRSHLEAMGHEIVESPGAFGGYQAIRIVEDSDGGFVLIGGSDPRKDGNAMGY